MFVDIKKYQLKAYSGRFAKENPGYTKCDNRLKGQGTAISEINTCMYMIDKLGAKVDDLFTASATYLGKAANNFVDADNSNTVKVKN
ncbi:MAG: hypothetical protein J6U54_02155 [Clostridiales bacterium]|nr:hypothetical protein [Clostridiales bacterium]